MLSSPSSLTVRRRGGKGTEGFPSSFFNNESLHLKAKAHGSKLQAETASERWNEKKNRSYFVEDISNLI